MTSSPRSDHLLLSLVHLKKSGASEVTVQRLLNDRPEHHWLSPSFIGPDSMIKSARISQSVGASVSDLEFFQQRRGQEEGKLMIHAAARGVGALPGGRQLSCEELALKADEKLRCECD